MSVAAAARHATGALTLGVEEEFLLLDRVTGRPALRAPAILELLDDDLHVKPELMRYQLETVTGVCADLDQLGAELSALRRRAAAAAAELGCHLVASGVSPGPLPGIAALTDDPRYAELARRYGSMIVEAGTCGCHVHVGVPSREVGVQVLSRLRPYLATLLAITSNSPFADGRDTSWASRRYLRWSRWPSAMPPGVWQTPADYDAAVRHLVRRGRALDERSVYFHARLSPRYPTVELRIMDACLSAEDAVLVAGTVRALVDLAMRDAEDGVPVLPMPDVTILAALNAAARDGLDGLAPDPYTGRWVPQRVLLGLVLDRVADPGPLERLVGRLLLRGNGASRQRELWTRAGTPHAFAGLLAAATLD
ncbi:carboxylate-amine ligase [Nonomuraea pusilla]|uniref:Putative glutamate--cysteine ligase 2 n=1 Tax=Nonomuraea pusilla TaxID=46177 RepID=A0A1H8H7G0_9ACTN|nr:glutamate--cysteine ligase [Nonomuraea pusilla]SEN51458.1 carboxylate-amine ligase [Nonomuraea pusilla]